MTQPVRFAYFNLQSRGQVSRLLLNYTKTPYEQTTYSFGKIQQWTQKDKQGLGFDFPSLPYLIDGKFTITESRAIEKYIILRAKRTDLLGRNSKERAVIDNIEGVLRDIFATEIQLTFTEDFEGARKRQFQKFAPKLNYINSFIGSKNHLLNRITYPDFLLSVVFGYFVFFYPHEYSRWTNIQRVFQYINRLPEISAYFSSPKAMTALLVPEWANNPKFYDLKPIHEGVQIVSPFKQEKAPVIEPPEEIRPQPQMVIVKQEDPETPVLQQDSQPPKQQQEPVIKKKTQSTKQPKQFNTRVEEYIKAAEAANNKGTSEQKQGLQKSKIITPSKIGSSIGTNNVSWIQNKTSQNTTNPQWESKIRLGYWGIRGLGQVQRHLLTYCGHQFTQKIYKTREQWFNGDKLTLNLPFPNLPYLISGELKITESLAIDRFIIRSSKRHELLGKNLRDQTYVENFVKILSELFAQLRVLCFSEDDQKRKAQVQSKLNNNFSNLAKFIETKDYTFGYLTWTDFYIAQISYYVQKIFPSTYTKFTFLTTIRQSVNSNQEIQQYYEKTTAVKAPFMPPSARISF